MATTSRTTKKQAHEATEDEWREILDRAARYYLSMSGDEFVRAWKAGEIDLDDPVTHSLVVRVLMLMPHDR